MACQDLFHNCLSGESSLWDRIQPVQMKVGNKVYSQDSLPILHHRPQ